MMHRLAFDEKKNISGLEYPRIKNTTLEKRPSLASEMMKHVYANLTRLIM